MDPDWLTGRWIGERNGVEVVWQVEADGRLRADDRSASWTVSSDTLFVRFDPVSSESGSETAIYRIFASPPDQVLRRLFVYGFDLGAEGLHLTLYDPNATAPKLPTTGGFELRRAARGGTARPSAGAERP